MSKPISALCSATIFMSRDMPAFFDVEVAERVRTAGYPSEFRVDGTIGVKILPRWMLLAQSFNVVSEGSGNPAYGGSYDYYKLQFSALYTLMPNWWLQGGGFTTYAGSNAIAGERRDGRRLASVLIRMESGEHGLGGRCRSMQAHRRVFVAEFRPRAHQNVLRRFALDW